MLMPSALPCDSSQTATGHHSSLFASPPVSPPVAAQSTFNNIFTTCRALQAMLMTPATNGEHEGHNGHHQLPTPPMAHAILPPNKLRLRSRNHDSPHGDHLPRKKIVKRTTLPHRGPNKRRRALEDDMGRDDDIDSDLDIDATKEDNAEGSHAAFRRPHTPKRARIAPEILPLGLERSDFHDLQESTEEDSNKTEGTEVDVEADGEEWSSEDDRILVELILEKLKLSKTDWQECARSLGKDRLSVGRRWKSLMGNGDVGLKRARRNKIHGTWR